MKTEFPNPDDILNFNLTIEPDEGMYKGGSFRFDFKINQNFPHDPPKVKCKQKIFHPNIDVEGNVCLNILREDWKPVLNLNAVIVGLQVRSALLIPCGQIVDEDRTVLVLRAESVRPAQQGSRRGSTTGPRRVQTERSGGHGRRIRQGHQVRTRIEMRYLSLALRFLARKSSGCWTPETATLVRETTKSTVVHDGLTCKLQSIIPELDDV